ncbi:MAG: transglutaminase domain-containing protein [Candidatus Methanomethylophilaceae archaeon]
MCKRNLVVAVFVLSLFMVPLALADEAYGAPESFVAYHDRLSKEDSAIYEILANPYGDGTVPTGSTWAPSVSLPSGTTSDAVGSVAKLMVLEDPRFYWLWIAPVLNDDNTLTFAPVEKLNTDNPLKEMEDFVKDVKSELKQEYTIEDAARAIDAELRKGAKYADGENKPSAGTAFGAIVLGEADAFGFAAAFNYAIREMYNDAVKVLTVAGKLHDSEGYSQHAWNVIKSAGDDWYGVDIALNRTENTDAYVMKASNDKGNSEGYTFAASHQQDLPGYTGLMTVFDVPEPYMKEIKSPEPSTAIEKYGPHAFVITIITVLCIVMIVYSRRG